jgi:hypothetical protein
VTHTNAIESLRAKGYDIGESYVQTGVGHTGGVLYYIVNGVAMTEREAIALDEGRLTLEQIANQADGSN